MRAPVYCGPVWWGSNLYTVGLFGGDPTCILWACLVGIQPVYCGLVWWGSNLYTVGLFGGDPTCILWACLVGIQPADFAGKRLKQCCILFAAARRWLVSATTFLGTRLSNQKT